MPRLFYARIIAPAYDRSRLRPPSPSHPRPLVVCPAFRPLPPRKSEERRKRTEGLKKGFSPVYTLLLSLLYSLFLSLFMFLAALSHPSRPSQTRPFLSSPYLPSSAVSQT